MNKIIWGTVILGGTYLLFKYAKNYHIDPKQKDIITILSQNFLTMDAGYLKSRANAVKGGNDSFSYEGKTYNTKTGLAIK